MLITTNRFLKNTFLFLFGGFAYGGIEIISRGYSHISMFIAGGICFLLIDLIHKIFSKSISVISQMLISAVIITVVEFITGLIVNLWLGLNVWDYSDKPYNIMGQVCLLYFSYWFMLSFIAIIADRLLRHYLLMEDKPRYRIL